MLHEHDCLSMPRERDERWWRRVGSIFEQRSGPMFGQDRPLASSGGESAASCLPSQGQASSGSRLTNVRDSGEALFDACTRGDLGDAERLLSDRADPCHRGEFGATPLLRAAELGHAGLVSLLLAHGGRHELQDDNNDTALLCACRMGHAGVARVLLSAGADPGVTNQQGNNSLDAALEARTRTRTRTRTPTPTVTPTLTPTLTLTRRPTSRSSFPTTTRTTGPSSSRTRKRRRSLSRR